MAKEYYASVFWKSRYKRSNEDGYQGTNYNKSFKTKKAARAEAKRQIKEYKKNVPNSKHLKFSAHVATVERKSSNNFWVSSKKSKGSFW